MKARATTVLFAAMLCLAPAASQAQLVPYSENFEGLVQSDPAALGNAGWLYYGNVFDPAFNYLYGYGPGPAPNGGPAFSAITTGQGGAAQGVQQLVIYSDYNSGEQSNGNLVEANVYREQFIGAGDVGSTWEFQFDVKHGDLVAPSTAIAFIKTLDPNSGYATTTFLSYDTTNLPTTWETHSILIPIGAGLAGQILQIGFACTTTNYVPSGMIYDNLSLAPSGATPTESSTWGRVKTLYR